MVLNSDDIDLVFDTNTKGNQIVGLRFNGVSVPKEATVVNAFVQFTVDKTKSGTCNLTFKGENSGNPLVFSNASNNVSNRLKTTASVSWKPANW